MRGEVRGGSENWERRKVKEKRIGKCGGEKDRHWNNLACLLLLEYVKYKMRKKRRDRERKGKNRKIEKGREGEYKREKERE